MNSCLFVLLFFGVFLIEGGVFSLIEKKIEQYLNGDKYNGDMEDNRKHGIGKYIWFETKNNYDGEWSFDQMHGGGIFKYSDGAIYDGEWLDNERSGVGVYKSASGNVYVGNWLHGYCHGHGQLVTPDETYEGEWNMGVKNGIGEITYTSGVIYRGDFENNQPNGQGVYTMANGDIYEGTVVDGVRHGKGSYEWKETGQFFDGNWENGEMTTGTLSDIKPPTSLPIVNMASNNNNIGQDKIAKATAAADATRLKKKRGFFF